MIDIDVYVEMYLKPVATGVYDWIPIPDVRRANDVVIDRGNDNLNDDPGPGRYKFGVNDPNGDMVERNPMGAYFGSIRRGTQTRGGVLRVDDQFARTVANGWGSVGNAAGDVWTNGSSSGGTVSNSDWSVSSGAARHSLPIDGAYRVSELSKVTRPFIDSEVRLRIKVPTANITGTGALATEVWFRTADVSNFVAVSVAWQVDESIQIAFYDRTSAANRYLMAYTAIPGLNLGTTGVDYDLRCQVEGAAVRAKIWPVGQPEPMDWQVYASGAVVREGYTAVASYCFAGNTNTKPLVFQYDQLQARLMAFTGEVTKMVPTGTGEGTSAPRVTEVEVADMLDRLQTPGAAATQSVMRRSRTRTRRWLSVTSFTANAGDARTFTVPTSSLSTTQIGDFLFLFDSTGRKKEDTPFTIVGAAVVGADTSLFLSPDARDAIVAGDFASVYHPTAPTNTPIAYWPMEDGDRATQISSGLVGGQPMSIIGVPHFGADSGYACSKPILQVDDAELTGVIPDYVDTYQAFTLTFLLSMPSTDEAATGTDLVQFYCNGTGYSWDLRYAAAGNGSLQLLVFNSSFVQIFDSTAIDFSLRGDKCQITLIAQQVGGAVTFSLFKTKLDGSTGGVGPSTVAGVTTLGKILQVRVNPAGGYKSVAFGHLTVIPGVWDRQATFIDVLSWTNQAALHRLLRLCHEERLPVTYHADWDVLTTNMGPQKVDKVIDLLKQVPQSDGGFLYGPRGAMAIEYRSRGSLTNQPAMATFSMSAGHILELDPVVDYANVRNLVTVNRIDGTSAVAERTTGPLSTLSAPDGIGVRDQGFSLSLGSDVQTVNHADWRLGLGTLEQYRVSRFEVTAAGAASLSLERLMSINLGTRIDITGLEAKHIYEDLPQIVLGTSLRLGDRNNPTLEMNTAPYELFRALALTGDEYARLDGYDSTTNATMTTTSTGALSVVSQTGYYLWTTLASDFPLYVDIAGEVIRIDNITGDTSPQTFTVGQRSVNGVVKAHAVGETVQLADPNYWQFR